MNNNFNKKSQAAMEFLMTYGWAILVVLAAIAALAYFGVLSPDQFLPEKCILSPGLSCSSGFKVEPTQFTFLLQNSLGKKITVTGVSVTDQDETYTCSSTYSLTILNSGEHLFDGTDAVTCTSPDTFGASQGKFKGKLIIDYTETESTLTKKAYGTIDARIQ
tara:strand:- start:852 stop:1337 length:486 start_codon:yes stop_codon:yes gene_type:complete